MVETNHQVVMTQTPIIEMNGVHPRVGLVSSFWGRSSCVGMKIWIVVRTLPMPTHATSFYNAYKKKTVTLSLTLRWPIHEASLHVKWSTTWYGYFTSHFCNFFLLHKLSLQLELALVLTIICCIFYALLNLLVWMNWRCNQWIQTLQSLLMSSTTLLIKARET